MKLNLNDISKLAAVQLAIQDTLWKLIERDPKQIRVRELQDSVYYLAKAIDELVNIFVKAATDEYRNEHGESSPASNKKE